MTNAGQGRIGGRSPVPFTGMRGGHVWGHVRCPFGYVARMGLHLLARMRVAVAHRVIDSLPNPRLSPDPGPLPTEHRAASESPEAESPPPGTQPSP